MATIARLSICNGGSAYQTQPDKEYYDGSFEEYLADAADASGCDAVEGSTDREVYTDTPGGKIIKFTDDDGLEHFELFWDDPAQFCDKCYPLRPVDDGETLCLKHQTTKAIYEGIGGEFIEAPGVMLDYAHALHLDTDGLEVDADEFLLWFNGYMVEDAKLYDAARREKVVNDLGDIFGEYGAYSVEMILSDPKYTTSGIEEPFTVFYDTEGNLWVIPEMECFDCPHVYIENEE